MATTTPPPPNRQVPATRVVLDEMVSKNPSRLAYHTFEVADFGVPQIRKRVIAGRPEMIARLKAMPVHDRVSVADAFGDKLASDYFKNTTLSRDSGLSRCVRTVREPAFTICGSRSLSWCDKQGKTVRVMRPWELAILQSLPAQPSGCCQRGRGRPRWRSGTASRLVSHKRS